MDEVIFRENPIRLRSRQAIKGPRRDGRSSPSFHETTSFPPAEADRPAAPSERLRVPRDGNRSVGRSHVRAESACINLGELRSEKKDLRGIINPQEQHNE